MPYMIAVSLEMSDEPNILMKVSLKYRLTRWAIWLI